MSDIVTWRDIKNSLLSISDNRLDDIAAIEINGELVNFDVVEIEVDEIDDNRLVAYPTSEF